MVKVIATFKRRGGIEPAEFGEYYFNNHPALLWSLLPADVAAGLVSYVQNHARPLREGSEPPYDCVTELGFRDLESLQRWNAWYFGPEADPLRADEENFMDLESRVIVVAEDRTPPRPRSAGRSHI